MKLNEMDYSPLGHAVIAVFIQCVFGLITGQWLAGAVIGSVIFMVREHTQAEYRWIAMLGAGHRANMPLYGGFDPRVWDVASVLDFLVPIIACLLVYVLSVVCR